MKAAICQHRGQVNRSQRSMMLCCTAMLMYGDDLLLGAQMDTGWSRTKNQHINQWPWLADRAFQRHLMELLTKFIFWGFWSSFLPYCCRRLPINIETISSQTSLLYQDTYNSISRPTNSATMLSKQQWQYLMVTLMFYPAFASCNGSSSEGASSVNSPRKAHTL